MCPHDIASIHCSTLHQPSALSSRLILIINIMTSRRHYHRVSAGPADGAQPRERAGDREPTRREREPCEQVPLLRPGACTLVFAHFQAHVCAHAYAHVYTHAIASLLGESVSRAEQSPQLRRDGVIPPECSAHVHTHVNTHVHTHVHAHVHTHFHTHANTHVYTHFHGHVHTHVHTRAYAHV